MTNDDESLLEEFNRLCRKGTMKEVMAFHSKHGHQILRAIHQMENHVTQRSRDLARVLTFLLEEGSPRIAIALQSDDHHLATTLLNHPTTQVINLFFVTTPEQLEDKIHITSITHPDSTIVLYGGEDEEMKLSQEVKDVVYRVFADREARGWPISPTARLAIMHPQVSSLYDSAFLDKMILIKEEA